MTHPEFTSDQKDSKGKITTPRFANLLTKIVTAMEKAKFVTASLSCGQTKFMGVCCAQSTTLSAADSTVAKKHRRIDIRFWPADQVSLFVSLTRFSFFNLSFTTVYLLSAFFFFLFFPP
eukprot:m.125682 g.125682  ORF g.125682 m.125682 type:complete len:119 (+) comp15626_c6_seq1:862-1218(+)